MPILKFCRIFTLLLTASLIAACATTPSKPVGEWRTESAAGPYGKLLVIAVEARSTGRRVLEDRLVEAFETTKTEAVPSYEQITVSLKLSRRAIDQTIRNENLDGMLIMRMVGIKEDAEYEQPSGPYLDFDSMHEQAWEDATSGFRTRSMVLETNLYDARSRRLVWSWQSPPLERPLPRNILEAQIILAVATALQRGLILAE